MNKKLEKILTLLGVLVLIVILVSGFFATKYMTHKIEADERSSLLLRAQMIATLIDTNTLSKLSGR
jgi:sensor histidine kinase regulating citrate/malate metabolism